jgi:NAD+ diphosphatase
MPPFLDLGPKPRLGYTDSSLDRAAELRLDDAKLTALASNGHAGAYVTGGELVVMKANSSLAEPLFAVADAHALGDTTETIFLGLDSGAARFGIGVTPGTIETLKTRNDLIVTDLRTIAMKGLVAPEHLPPLAEAKAMLHWHARHRFCSNCGIKTDLFEAGWKRVCPACEGQHFPRTDPVVIMLAISGDRCLLGRSGRFAASMWSCLAGFVEPGEAIEDAVRREILEEAAIRCGRITYFRSQPWPFPMSLMIGCHAEALNDDIVIDRNELEDARWFTRDEVALMLMRKHPDGLGTPPPVAIAHHIIRAWIEGESAIS